jgi:hypothetical protein
MFLYYLTDGAESLVQNPFSHPWKLHLFPQLLESVSRSFTGDMRFRSFRPTLKWLVTVVKPRWR